MHDLDTPHPLQAFWTLAAGPMQAESLALALELGAIDALAQPQTAATLAAAQGWHAANTSHWLELLWSMGVCERSAAQGEAGPVYGLAPAARRFLHSGSPEACGAAWLFRRRSLQHASTLLKAQLTEGPAAAGTPFAKGNAEGWAAAARAQIGQEQQAVTVPAALAVLSQVPEALAARRLLDLGGGPGWVAIALARQLPGLQATVFDWPETVAVAAQNIAQAGLADRVRTLGGDLGRDAIGSGYDLVWCSSVLHFVPDRSDAIAKVHAALRPGGVFVCAHAEVPGEPEEAARVLPFYTPMRMVGRHVTARGVLEQALAQAGFERIERIASSAFPMAPLTVLVARCRSGEGAA